MHCFLFKKIFFQLDIPLLIWKILHTLGMPWLWRGIKSWEKQLGKEMRHGHGKEKGLARWHKKAGNTLCLPFLDIISQILSWGPEIEDRISFFPVL